MKSRSTLASSTRSGLLMLASIGLALAAQVGNAKDKKPNLLASVPAASRSEARSTLFFLKLRGGVLTRNANGTGGGTLVPIEAAGNGPDGIAVDLAHGHVYWTNMGKVDLDDGTVMRADLDGRNVKTIVPSGGTFTPKQLKIDSVHRKLYWSDREGMRVMRSNLDGSRIETLVVTGNGDADRKDAAHWCVGIAVDARNGKLYWTQKGGDNAHKGTIKRANLEIPAGQTAANRKDIEVLFAELPEPIDLELDETHRLLYWTDRGDNTISRVSIDAPLAADPAKRADRQILVRDVGEAIGVALDLRRNVFYYTSLGGVVGAAGLDGSNPRIILSDAGALTGIAVVDLP